MNSQKKSSRVDHGDTNEVCTCKPMKEEDTVEIRSTHSSDTFKKRQGLIVTILELRNIIADLENQCMANDIPENEVDKMKWMISIINKKGLSDTWKIEK